jgi:hypothetical protein
MFDFGFTDVRICRFADEKNKADDGNLLFHGETKMGVFCIGIIFCGAILHGFDTRLIAFRRRLIAFRKHFEG